MDSTQQLQMVVAEVQAARQQVAALNAQIREIEGTLVAVESQPKDKALHRQMGSILVEVEDRNQLIEDLKSTLETMNSAVKTVTEKEKELVSTYEQLRKSLEG